MTEGDQLFAQDVKMEFEGAKENKEDKKEAIISFSSTWKYACKIVVDHNKIDHYLFLIKGAPEKIWGFCKECLYKSSI